MAMTSRERMLAILNHREADRVAIDFGGTDCTGIMLGPYMRLAELMGMEVPRPIYLHDMMQQQTIVSDEMADAFGSDVKMLYGGWPAQWRDATAYNGVDVKLPDRFRPKVEANGDLVAYSSDGRPTMKMPKDGYFFDFPFHNLAYCETIADLEKERDLIENYNIASYLDLDMDSYTAMAKQIRESADKLVVGLFYGHIFQAGQVLRGWSQFPMDLIANPALAEALMTMAVDGHIKNFDKWFDAVGQYIDVIEMTDDMGMQDATWVSPAMYRKSIKPHHRRLFSHIKSRIGDKFLFLHSCGSVYPLIGDFIEMGVQILNPVQYSARDMELTKLKKEFGADLTFWGGGVDTQNILPFASPEEVADEVKRNLDIMAKDGGYVFAAVHNITEGVPAENIRAAYSAALEYRG